MILVDTSVLIDALRGRENAKVLLLRQVVRDRIPFGISPYTFQEVLQGARSEAEYAQLHEYLAAQMIYALPSGLTAHEQAARLFFTLRRKGVTIRSTIDALIALTAIHHNLYLLHSDRDFDAMAQHAPELKILNSLSL